MLHILNRGYTALVTFLDRRVFPLAVAYVTHPIVIMATMGLLIPLIVWATDTTVILFANSYLNVASAAVSSIVLAQSLKLHVENKRLHAQHHDDLRALHAKVDALASPVAPTPKPVTRRKVASKASDAKQPPLPRK